MQGPHEQESQPPQGLEAGEEELPVYDPATPAWLRPGGPVTIPAEPCREDGVVALACAMGTPADRRSEIKGTIYGIEGIASGFLDGRWPWEDLSAGGGNEARTSGDGEVEETEPGHLLTTTGNSPLLSICFCIMGALLR